MITLKTLHLATAQQVYDQVALHLMTQKEACGEPTFIAGEPSFKCKYHRGVKRCAAGCLIGEDEYKPQPMEGNGWGHLVMGGTVPREHSELIQTLQTIHDMAPAKTWPEKLREVAETYNLTPFSFPTIEQPVDVNESICQTS